MFMSKKCLKQECNSWSTEDGLCFSHSPLQAKKRALAQSKGGSVGKRPKDRILVDLEPVDISCTKDVTNLLSDTVNKVRMGLIDI